MTTTPSTEELWAELAARAAHPAGRAIEEPDPLQRHLLCAATGLHSPGPDGRCRDCTAPIEPTTPVHCTQRHDHLTRRPR